MLMPTSIYASLAMLSLYAQVPGVAHIMLAGLVLPDTRYSIIMKKRMIWNGNVVANLEESGYLDNDKMLLQCYMRVESGSPW